MLLCRILSLRSCVCSELVRRYPVGRVGGMACLARLIVRTLRRREPNERPVCVFATAPLIGNGLGEGSPPVVFANCCVQAGQALGIASDTVLDTQQVGGLNVAPVQVSDMQVPYQPHREFDQLTGGRYVVAPYSGTYFVQGVKFYDKATGRLMVVVSTNVSTRFAEFRHSVPYMQYAAYMSWEEHHNRTDGGGMDAFPTFQTCSEPRMFGDMFPHLHGCVSMEEALEADDILDYARYICGFHIQGMGQSIVDENLCPLDWYYQSCQQRMKDPNVWDHYLILDAVSPVDFWKASTIKYLGAYYWPDHSIGCDASWSESTA